MRDMKIRILNDAHVEDVDLWLASGTVRVSRTSLLNTLFEAFHAEIAGKESTLTNISECVRGAVKIGHTKANQQRFNE